MKWLSKKGSRGIAYFMIMVLVLTSVMTGDVMRVKADPEPTIYTCSLTVSPYDGEHGTVKYIDSEGQEQTASSSGETVMAQAVLYDVYQGWHVSQIVYNGVTDTNPNFTPIDFTSEGNKSFSITFEEDATIYTCSLTVAPYDGEHGVVKYIDSNDDEQTASASGETVQAKAVLFEAYQGWHVSQIVYNGVTNTNPGSTPIDFTTDGDKSFSITFEEDTQQDPPPQIYEYPLTVSEYAAEYGWISYTLNGEDWFDVPEEGITTNATAVCFGAHQNGLVSQIVYNGVSVDDLNTNFFDFTTSGAKTLNVTFVENENGGGNNNNPTVIQIKSDSYTNTHGKIQYSITGSNVESEWIDIPAAGLTTNTDAGFVRAVPNEGYSVSYKIDGNVIDHSNVVGLSDNPALHYIQDIRFTSQNRSLTVETYDTTKGTIEYSTDGTTWTPAPIGEAVQARYVKAVPAANYDVSSYSLNSSTIYTGDVQTLTAENNTLSNVSFISNAGDGKYLLSVDYLTNVSCTVTVTFLNSSGVEIEPATVGSVNDIPDGTAKIRIALSDKRFLKSIQVFRNAGSQPGANGAVEIGRPSVEEGLWKNGTAEFTASDAYSYKFVIQLSNTKNVGWSYRESDRGTDLFVEHCKLYLLDSSGNKRPYIDESDDNKETTDYASYNLTIDQTYKFLIVPDYGYQIVGLSINGYTVAPTNDMGVFSFTMKNTNFHFKGVVKTAGDIVVAPDEYKNATIANGSNAVTSGNVKMSITKNLNPDASAAAVAGADAVPVATVDINLDKVISKGTEGQYWSENLTTTTRDVTVSIPVSAAGLSAGQTYSVVRDHEGIKTELNATYNSTTGMLTFGSNQFSEYTIVKKGGTPETTPSSAETKKEDTDSDSGSSSDSNDDNDDNNGSTGGIFANTLGSIVNKTATGGLVANTVIKDWNDLDKVLLDGNTNTASNKKKVLSDKEKARGELVQVVLNKKDTTVPASTFESLYRSNKSGLHVFIASGTALTFMNNYRLKGQKALDLSCTVTGDASSKTITFKTKAKLNAKNKLHTTVPLGVKRVTLYKIDKNGNWRRVRRARPTNERRICFDITELTTYRLVYEY